MPQTILHLAVQNNAEIDAVNQALAMPGVNINEQDDNGDTALHIAVRINQSAVVSLLMQNGADYKIRNNQHRTPKVEAKKIGNWDIVSVIEREFKNAARRQLEGLERENTSLRQAVSFLYDKMRDAHKVAFNTTKLEGNAMVTLGVPDGFQRENCKFFSAVGFRAAYNVATLEFASYDTNISVNIPDIVVREIPVPRSGCSFAVHGVGGIMAAKPVMTEQEIAQKKAEYRLTQ